MEELFNEMIEYSGMNESTSIRSFLKYKFGFHAIEFCEEDDYIKVDCKLLNSDIIKKFRDCISEITSLINNKKIKLESLDSEEAIEHIMADSMSAGSCVTGYIGYIYSKDIEPIKLVELIKLLRNAYIIN